MISNTAQINTFIGGMNMDSDISVLPSNQYRYAENVRIITNDNGTTGALLNIEGVRDYDLIDKANKVISLEGVVIGTCTILEYGIIATKDNNNINHFYRLENFDSAKIKATEILRGRLGLCEDLKATPNLSIVGNFETNTVIKIYFTDGNSSIKCVNILGGKYEKGSVLVDIEGNIKNPTAIDLTPGADLPPFELVSLSAGNLPSGTVQYCYLLFNLHGTETTVSPLSQMINLTESTTNQNSKDFKGSYPNTSSGKSCTVLAAFTSKDFEKCRIISIRYTENNMAPLIVVVDEIDLLSNLNTIVYTDSGNSFMGEITIDEFNAMIGYLFFAKSITKMNNRLFASNITEDTWNPGWWDARAYRGNSLGVVTLLDANEKLPLTFKLADLNVNTVSKTYDCINPYNVGPYNNVADNCACDINGKLGGTGINVSYSFITHDVVLSDINSGSRLKNDCSMNVSSDGTNIPNYADPVFASEYTGYLRDEVYRFGIIFYNHKYIPSPVYWIGDIRMPHATVMKPFEFTNGRLIGKALGVKFNVRNAPDGAVAYEIVRCDRTESDRSIVLQCVGSLLYEYRIQETEDDHVGKGASLDTSLEMRPAPFLTCLNSDIRIRRFDKDGDFDSGTLKSNLIVADYLRLVSPEICLQKDDSEKFFKDTKLEPLYTYTSPIETSYTSNAMSDYASGLTRVFAQADTILSTDADGNFTKYERVTITDKSYNCAYIDTDGKYRLSLLVGATLKGGIVISGRAFPYNANIAKYYNTIGGNGITIKDIDDAKYPMDIPYNAYQNVIPYRINVGEKMYTNWGMSQHDNINDLEKDTAWDNQPTMGPCGPSIIAHVLGLGKSLIPSTGYNISTDKVNAVPVFNVRKEVNPYNGNTYVARTNSVYCSSNGFSKVDNNIVNVFGGDTYLNVLDYPCTMTYQGNDAKKDWATSSRFIGCYIPFESSINMNLFMGDMAHMTNSSGNYLDSHLLTDITLKGTYHVQDRPYFVYNTVYSSLNGSRQYVPKSIYAEDNVHTSNRIYVSLAKTNNEVIDSWATFKVADYLDVDNQYGKISNLYVFKDKLFYFLDTALGIAAVNERALITDGNIGLLTLGTGGVLSRFDYVTSKNGSSVINDRSITNSDNVMYWYDLDKNEICAYNGSVNQISKEKFVQTYLNEMFTGKRNCSLGMYDKKYNEIWFKFYNKSLIYNEQVGAFTSFYTFSPEWSLSFSDKIVGVKNSMLFRINSIDTDKTYNISKNAKVQIVINKDYDFTKVFDNVRLSGVFTDNNNQPIISNPISKALFTTKGQDSGEITNINVDYREDTYRFPIPRQEKNDDPMSYSARLRGKYLICNYNFVADNEYTFKIPNITTTYRYSKI